MFLLIYINVSLYVYDTLTQITCFKLTTEALEQEVKYVQSSQ